MFEHHPSREEFESLLRRGERAASPRSLKVVRHLLADCPTCREHLQSMGWKGRRLERLLNLRPDDFDEQAVAAPPVAGHYDYSTAFAAAERSLDAFFAVGSPVELGPEELLGRLTPLDLEEQIRRIAAEPRYGNPLFVRFLVDRSHASRYENPDSMLRLALLAHLAAEACTIDSAGSEERLNDLRCRAWGQFANALRVSGRLAEAEDAFATATRYRDHGTGDPPLHARLLEHVASLRVFQRRFEEAMALADEAGQIYRELSETHALATTMVQKAIASLYSGDAEGAVRLLNRAIPLVDQEEEPHLLLAACHNLIRCYIDLDRPEQAMSLYFKVKDLYREFKDELILLRAAWQEGQLLRELGHPQAAEAALQRARKGFLDRDLGYEVAMVSLDLAAVYVKMGAVQELKSTVTETMPIFRALRLGRETLATLIQLVQTADQEQQAMELIRSLSARLKDTDHQHLFK